MSLAAVLGLTTTVLGWSAVRIVVLAAVLAVALLVLVLVGVILRRALMGGTNEPTDTGGVSFEKLRRMHEAGELSDEEFAAVKASLARRMNRGPEGNGQGGGRLGGSE